MWLILIGIVSFVSCPALTSVAREQNESCSLNDFSCSGECVELFRRCDGIPDCDDGSDEDGCLGVSGQSQLTSEDVVLHRYRRQARKCRKSQWRCADGSCISFDQKCDGLVDCPDGSDETFPLCRGSVCQPNWFRCTYGACVDGTAPCNGVDECADRSDELLPRCRNESEEVRGKFRCADGSSIDASDHCDGKADCADGSDETVRACAGVGCRTYLFQCAYGACVDQGSDCNGIQECADNSDESPELCNKQGPTVTSKPPVPQPTGQCVLPKVPTHGGYVSNVPNASPGQGFKTLQLNVTCKPGYGVEGSSVVFCYDGVWSGTFPKCIRFCKLERDPSVRFKCLVKGSVTGDRDCNTYEPAGTTVRPECNAPNYYSPVVLPDMRCVDGFWDTNPRCSPECGRITPQGVPQAIGGRFAKKGEFPWHAGIYDKSFSPFKQICGGSLVTNTLVISAAHCFYTSQALPASQFAVAVGKLYRPYNDKNDDENGAQKSDVKEIKIPVRFRGRQANFQDDIALVIVAKPFEYQFFVRPVCLDFDVNFDRRQLLPGKIGKVAGWGLTAVNGPASPILKVVELPSRDIDYCISKAPPGFGEYITSDKVCAGYENNGTAVCQGDSGGGLVFPEQERGVERYYLRGIVSTAPDDGNLCNDQSLTTFTQVLKHEQFIKEYYH